MKSLFHEPDTEEILLRIDALRPQSSRQWGTMEVAQMLAHCSAVLAIGAGSAAPKRAFIGRIIGPLVKSGYYNDQPWKQGLPTSPSAVISGSRDFDAEKQQLQYAVAAFHRNGPEASTRHPHPFLGKLTPEQWGKGMYKHLDHHLKQFGS